MGRIIEARGPVVAALKRYDPGLRVRWSHERKKWAIDAPLKLANPNWIAKPIRYVRVGDRGDHWIEVLLPEYSERNIQYKDCRYVVCWVKNLDWRVVGAIARRDAHQSKRGAVDVYEKDKAAKDKEASSRNAAIKEERVYEAFDRVKYESRHNHNAEDGTGVSLKGMSK